MAQELVFGHQSPDTDAIDAAIAYSYLQNRLGFDTEAVALGEPNDETKFVLNKFGQKAPRVIKTASNEVDSVMLVDHNESQQSVSDLKDVTVTHVVDHHKIGDFETSQPLFYRAEPVGCTSTILWKMFYENGVEIPKKIAGLMLSAIISDTLLLKSPTTTDDDKAAVNSLAKIAGVDYQSYGLEMLKAGTNISDKTADDLVAGDAKSFEMNGKSVRVAQINVVDLQDALKRQQEFQDAMDKSAKANNYDLFLLLITNVLDSNTTLMATAADDALISEVEKTFNKKFTNGQMNLPGVVSRKKQVVPPLQAELDK